MAHTRLYTTRATLEMEQAVQDMAERLAQAPGAAMALARVDEAIKDLKRQGYPLSAEQASAIHHATTGAGRIALIEGAAGSGKTTTLRPIVDLYRERGYRVLGAAIAWRTALALGSDCAMEALAVRKLLAQAARGQLALDGAPTLLVIDEAGLLSTREMHHILVLGERHGLTLLFAGDTGQQQPIEAGPGLRLVQERIGSMRVDAMHRQKADVEDIITPRYAQAPEQVRRIAARMTRAECERVLAEHERTPAAARTITPWQISASEAFRDGRAGSALFAYHARGRVHLCPDDEAALARLVSDWARYEREEPGKRTAVLARTNAERRALSARMREVHLPPSDKRTTFTVPVHHPDRGKAPVPLDIAVGERLRIGATHWERRLFNGTIVTVEALEQRKQDSGGIRVLITGRTDTGREVRFHHDEIRDYHGRIRLEHGYALTIASAQGLTADRIFLYADAKPARQTIYPAATRHRERLDFYLDRRPLVLDIIARAPEDAFALEVDDDVILAYLGERWSRGAPKAAALDYPALPPQLRPPRPEGGEAAVRPRPAVALDRSITRAARAFRTATLEFRDGNTALAVADAREVWRVAQASHEAQAQRVAEVRHAAQALHEAEAERAAQAQREAEVQREAEIKRKAEAERETQARQDFNAALAPHTEALCRHFLREGVRQHDRWHVLISYFDGSFSIDIPLSGPSQGTWRLEALPRGQDGQGALAGLFGKKAVLPLSRQLPGAVQAMWKDRLAGKPGDLLDLVHLMGRRATAAEAREEGYAFRERQAEAEREAQAQRVTDQERHGFNTAAAPWAEALCQHYLPLGVKRDGEWRVRINIDGKNEYPLNIPLWGLWRGRWTLEGAGREEDTLFGVARSQLDAQRSLLERDGRLPNALARRRPHHVDSSGPAQEMWRDRLAGKPGDLLDIIQAGGRYATEAEALAAGHSFIEAEAEAQHRLNADLVPHTEALCRRFLPKGVKRDGEWRSAHTLFDASDCSVSVQLSGLTRGAWKNATTGEQGEQLLDLVHRTGEHLTITETMEAARALIERQVEAEREAELQREAQAQRVSGQARHDFNTAAAPWAEALCRRYLPLGVKRDGHWHARINIDEKNEYPLNIPLSGRWQGRWRLEGAGRGQGNPLDIVQSVRSRIEAQRSLLERDLFPKVLARRVRPHHVVRSGAGEALWQDKLAGTAGDLLDLIQAESPHATEAKALAAGRSFIEAEAEARRQLAAELAPHAEAVCERYLPGGVKRDGHWRVEHTVLRARDFAVSVQLSGPARGAWRTESGALNGDLLDLIHLRARYDTITGAMAAGRTIRDELIEAHREAQLELRREWDAHAATALGRGDDCFHTPGYRDLIQRTQDLDERGDLHAALKQRIDEHKAHQTAYRPLMRHAAAALDHADAREQLHNEQQPQLGGGHPVFNGQYPRWQREADALITKGQAFLDTPDPAQLAETNLLGKVHQITHLLARTIDKDRRYYHAHIETLKQLQLALRHEWDAHAARALAARAAPFETPGYDPLIKRTQDLDRELACLRDPSPLTLHAALKQRIDEHKAHETAYRPLMRHAAAAFIHAGKTHEQLRHDAPPPLGGGHPVFDEDQYPQWRREADALIAKGRALLNTPDPAQLAETSWLGKVHEITQMLERTIDEDRRYRRAHLENINATLVPHAEALCRRYLPDGVEQDGQWRARIDQGEHTCSVTVQLSGAERGAWKNETTGKQGSLLLTVIHIGARHGTLAETLALAHKLERELSRKITISQGYGMGL